LAWTGLAVCFPFSFLGTGPQSVTTWLLVVVVGVCVFGSPTFQVQGLKWVYATAGGIFNLVASVVFAVLLGWACLGQRLTGPEAAGMLIVLSSGALVTLFAGDQPAKDRSSAALGTNVSRESDNPRGAGLP
jgi:drug/metabolite transporter (DMT)-like permease